MNSSTSAMDVNTLMAQMRDEVTRRKRVAAGYAADGRDDVFQSIEPVMLTPLPMPHLPKPRLLKVDQFHLNDFLALHDEDFVDAAYRGVLKRSADDQGQRYFLSSLRNGTLSKIEILGRLRYSTEGRRKKVTVRRLLPFFSVQHMYRLPVIGTLIAFVVAIFRLPRLGRSLQALEGYQHQRNSELEAAIKNLATVADGNERQLAAGVLRSERGLNQFSQRTASLTEAWTGITESIQTIQARVDAGELSQRQVAQRTSDALDRIDGLDGRLVGFESQKLAIEQQLADVIALSQRTSAQLETTLHETLNALRQRMNELNALEQRMEGLNALERRIEALNALEQRVDGLNGLLQSERSNSQNSHVRLIERIARVEGRVHEQGLRQPSAGLAALEQSLGEVAGGTPVESRFEKIYFAFEQRFRGSRDAIRQRLAYYVPLLRDSVVGKEGARVLDIGCGRGEWLELLRDENMSARGIDINSTMARECIERGLDVEAGDAIALLKRLPDNALGALTGFHIIEHVPLDTLIEFIEQAQRVVQPGGLLIFETPNPENVVVGACNFYIDPTHQRPLPPVLMQFLLEAGGFVDVAIHRVNANLLPQVFDEPSETDGPALRTALNYLRSVFLCAPDYSVVGYVT